ncbi:linoleate 13S-lipoxygenase 2-1, chloroplastic-like protein [Tanacetum coccineum]
MIIRVSQKEDGVEWPLKSKLDPEVYGPPESAITTEIIQQVIGCFISVEQVDMDKDKSEEAETNVDSSTKSSKLFKSHERQPDPKAKPQAELAPKGDHSECYPG